MKADAPPPAEAPDDAPAPVNDLDALWDSIFTDGEKNISSIHLIRISSRLAKMDEESFTVHVSGAISRRHVERNRQLLEELMEKRTGKRRVMRIESGDEGTEPTVEEAAANAEQLLGTRVTIE